MLQQALSFQAASHALANQLDQYFQLAPGWRLNALKAGRTIVATHLDAVQEQDMEVDIQVQCTLGFHLAVEGLNVSIMRNQQTVLQYDAERLEEALLSKHLQTASLKINPGKAADREVCTIESVSYCKWPSIIRFLELIQSGEINLDFTMSEKNGRINDHGFLWRIDSARLEELYLYTEQVTIQLLPQLQSPRLLPPHARIWDRK